MGHERIYVISFSGVGASDDDEDLPARLPLSQPADGTNEFFHKKSIFRKQSRVKFFSKLRQTHLPGLADTRAIDLHRDAVLGQVRARTDAAAHQHHRALQRAGRDDHLARRDDEALAVAVGELRRHAKNVVVVDPQWAGAKAL